MLTSIFYYDHYRPYIVKTENTRVRKTPARENNGVKPEVALNKSLNTEIVKYARGIYKNTTDLKHTSKKLESDITNYSKYKDYDEFDADVFEGNFNADLEKFSDAYNKSLNFLKNQQHSAPLAESADSFLEIVDSSQALLADMGITKKEDGNLEFSVENNDFVKSGKIANESGAAKEMFSNVYEKTTGLLNDPMSTHMNFKSLNYYYNYKVDKVHVDTFQIIKTGLLVNLAL